MPTCGTAIKIHEKQNPKKEYVSNTTNARTSEEKIVPRRNSIIPLRRGPGVSPGYYEMSFSTPSGSESVRKVYFKSSATFKTAFRHLKSFQP
ncbi:MAG TPA: hypothetical protein DDY52_05720 [Candidatus Moranbacteria bacterium]|nr:hypothetical protein [Candidatus Moranbacteria bacterium]